MKESPLYDEIMTEGRVEIAHVFVLDVLEDRFGKRGASALKETLQSVQNTGDLSELHHKAVRCRTLGGFRKLLAEKLKSQPAH